MNKDIQPPQTSAPSSDDSLRFTITMEEFNSAFGISADTLRSLADSYGVTPEQLIVRAITMWAKADIPNLDLDSPRLSPDQIQYLATRRQNIDASNNQPSQSLQESFKRLFEGKGDPHANAELVPRNGGNS